MAQETVDQRVVRELTECGCVQLVKDIHEKYQVCNRNSDEACHAWRDLSKALPTNKHEFEPYADTQYACTCPTCGKTICRWCV